MNVSKFSGPYSVPVTVLKFIRNYVSEPLAFLANDSFTSGSFSDKLKLVRITLIFKTGSRFGKDNYRPISFLSNFSKRIEKALYHRLYRYLEDFKIFYPLLFGFRENRQPCMLLSQSLNLLAGPLIDNNKFDRRIFINLEKAFHTVNHAILLTKLNHYGIRGNVHELHF